MSSQNQVVLKTTEDLKHFERNIAEGFAWKGDRQQMVEANLGALRQRAEHLDLGDGLFLKDQVVHDDL